MQLLSGACEREGTDVDRRLGTFWWATLTLLGLGLVIRVGFGFVANDSVRLRGDAATYQQAGHFLASGQGLTKLDPSGAEVTMSEFPPAFPATLALLDLAGVDSVRGQRVLMGALSSAAVVMVALLGRRLGGDRIGIVAAAIVAVHPLWVQPGPVLMSEGLYLVLVPLLLFVVVGVLDRPSWPRVVAAGACAGACILTRSEATLLVVVLAAALVVLGRGALRARVVRMAALLGVVAVVVAPWMVRNKLQADDFAVSTNAGGTLSGSYCDEVFGDGPRYGSWSLDCSYGGTAPAVLLKPPDEELTGGRIDRAGRESARTYARQHLGELPNVVATRVGRLWGVAHTGNQLTFDVGESRYRPAQRLGQYLHWLLLPLAVAGAFLLPRPAWRRWALVALPAVTVTVSAALIYGSTRMRAAAEPTIALFAAVTLVWAWSRLAHRRSLAEEMGVLDEAATTGVAEPSVREPTAGAGNRGQ